MPYHLPHLLNPIPNCSYRWGEIYIYTVPELNQGEASYHFIYKSLWLLSWLFGHLLSWPTRQIHQHRCWSKPVLSNHGVFQCWAHLPSSQHKGFGGCRPPAQMHWDVTEAGRCSLRVVQRWCDLNTCDLEAFSMKAVFFWAVSMNQEDNKGK